MISVKRGDMGDFMVVILVSFRKGSEGDDRKTGGRVVCVLFFWV